MKTNRIFAEDIKACPKCGSTDFYQDWAGGGCAIGSAKKVT